MESAVRGLCFRGALGSVDQENKNEPTTVQELRFIHLYICPPHDSTTSTNLSHIASAPPPLIVGPGSYNSPPEQLATNALLVPARASFLDTNAPPKGIMARAK